MPCGIKACATHKLGNDMSQECTIRLDSGLLIIDSNKIWFQTKLQMLYLYEAAYPFTRENLMALNDIDSQEPDAYVRALKRSMRRITHVSPPDKIVMPTRAEITWETYQLLRQELTIEKALTREYVKTLQEKEREIEELRRKLKSEISPYSNEKHGATQSNSTTGDQRVGGKGADSS